MVSDVCGLLSPFTSDNASTSSYLGLRSVARKAQFDLALVNLRKIEISTSVDNLEVVN